MKNIETYITEKLVIDSNVNKSKLAEIYGVKVNDKVLVLTHNTIASKKEIGMYVAIISSIHDNKFFVKNRFSGKEITKIPFDFENPHNSSPKVADCFGFWKGLYEDKPGWVAVCKKDKAIKNIENKLKRIKDDNFTWNGLKLKPEKGKTIRQTLEELKEELERND